MKENRRLHFLLSRKEEWGEDKLYIIKFICSDSKNSNNNFFTKKYLLIKY